MQKLLSKSTKAAKVKDPNKVQFADPLSEEELEVPEPEFVDGSGSAPPGDPSIASLSKLTSIVEMLAEERGKSKQAGAGIGSCQSHWRCNFHPGSARDS